MYYYDDGEHEVGPFSLEKLNALRERGLIASGTLVRRADETSWSPLANFNSDPGLLSNLRPDGARDRLAADVGPWTRPRAVAEGAARKDPVLAPPSTLAGWLAEPQTPWRRYAARILDLTVNGALGLSILAIIFFAVVPDTAFRFFSIFETRAGTVADFVLTGLIASLIGGSLVGVSGLTLGKVIFGVKVTRTDGTKLGLAAGVRRDLSVLLRGLGLCLPIVALLTMWLSYRSLTKDGTTGWDKGRYTVWHRPSGPAQYILNVVGIILIILSAALTRTIGEL